MPTYTLQDFRTEFVSKGRGGYNKGTAVYTDGRGEQKEKTIMSFSNPAVYETLNGLKALPTKIEVEFVKDDKYYNWAKVTPVSNEPAATLVTGNGKAVSSGTTRSSYETPEERAAKQLLIVKQSCLAQAVAFNTNDNASTTDILEVAQEFVDWVYAAPDTDLFDSPNEIPE